MSFSLAIVKQKYLAFGGAEKVINEAILAFASSQEIELSILARSWTLPSKALFGTNCRLIRCNPAYLGRAMRARSFVRAVTKQMSRFDLVQAHEPLPGAHIYRAGSGLHLKWLRQLAHGHSDSEQKKLFDFPMHQVTIQLEQQMFDHPALGAVIANSQMVAQDLVELYPHFDHRRVHLIWNGVDHDHFHPERRLAQRERIRERLGIPKQSKVLLLMGSGWHRKGVFTALEFLAALPEPILLLIAGKESHPRRFLRAAKALGLSPDRLRWIGPTTNPLELFAAADVFVQPSMYDQMPNAALEAMACGLPVVVSKTSGTRDLVEDGIEGYVCDWHSPTDWIEPILRALAYSERMGFAAYQRVLPFTFERMLGEWKIVYQELLGLSLTNPT